MFQCQHRFDDTKHTGRRFSMPQVGLHCADDQRVTVSARGSIHCTNCPQFDWIAKRCTGTMRLDVLHRRRRQSGSCQRTPHHRFLRRTTRSCEAVAAAVLVHRAAANHSQHPIAIRSRC